MTHLLSHCLGVSLLVVMLTRTASASQDIGVLAVLDLEDPELPYVERVGLAIDKWIKAENKCPHGDFWYDGKCRVLNLGSDLCPRNTDVLVLEKPTELGSKFPLRPICKNIECDYVSVWWAPLKKCLGILEAAKMCGKQGEVLFDIFYDIYCECKSGSGNLFPEDKCYKFGEKGPCKEGELFKSKSSNEPKVGICEPKA